MGEIKAGTLDRRASFYKKTSTQNSFGEPSESYEHVETVFAGKSALNAQNKEDFEAVRLTGKDLFYITIRYRSGIERTMIVLLDRVQYGILSISEIGRREGWKLLLEELANPVNIA